MMAPKGETMIEIERIGLDRLADYNGVPMLTPIDSRLAVHGIDGGLGGFRLVEGRSSGRGSRTRGC